MFSSYWGKNRLIYAFVPILLILLLARNWVILAQSPATFEAVELVESPRQPDNQLYLAVSGPALELTQGPAPGTIIEAAFTEPVLVAPLVDTVQASLVRTTLTSDWSPPSPDPMGIGYLAAANRLLVVDSEVEEAPALYWHGVNFFEISLSGNVIDRHTTFTSKPNRLVPNNFAKEPTGIAVNPANGHYFISDDDLNQIFEVDLGADGHYGTSDDIITAFSTAAFGSLDAEGLAFDSWQGHLYVVGGASHKVYHISPGANGRFDGVPPDGDDQATTFDVAEMGLIDPEGITFNPDNGHLYILSGKAKLVAETTSSGELIRLIDLSFLKSKRLSDLAYAPASNNSGDMRLYIVDRAVDNNEDPTANDGKLYEIAFPPLPPTPPDSVTISGPATGVINGGNYTFIANVSPPTVTLPLVYTWQATGQPATQHTNGLNDEATFVWDSPGLKTVTVTVTWGDGPVFEASCEILIAVPEEELQRVYLPLVLAKS